jgi:putative nucleotidyltransferase with HDIG domain
LVDIDVVTLGSGLTLARAFAETLPDASLAVYENFGTALVKTPSMSIEFAGARKESYRTHSRKPAVENGDLQDDQQRRDFTINALSLSLNADDFGRLIDPFNGLLDLRDGIIRTPLTPSRTFSDDPLRMLRAIRFAARLRFRIEDATYRGLISEAHRIEIISQERIAEELNKLLLTEQPSQGFKLLFDTGLLKLILPELHRMQGVERINGQGHKDNFYHTLQVVDNACRLTDNLWLRWAALLHDIAKPLTKRFVPGTGWTFHGHEERGARLVPKIFGRLKLPQNEKMRYVQKLVRLHQRPIALVDEIITDSAIRRLVVEAGEDLNDLLTLCRADITTRNEAKHHTYLANYDHIEARIREIEERDNLRNWQPPITGEIIMQHFGLPPSPMVGQIKTAVREAILEGIIPNEYEPAFEYMKHIGSQLLTGGSSPQQNPFS